MNKIKAGMVAAAMLANFSGAALAESGMAESGIYGAVDVGHLHSKTFAMELLPGRVAAIKVRHLVVAWATK